MAGAALSEHLVPMAVFMVPGRHSGQEEHGGSCPEDLFVGTAAHYSLDKSCWLQIDCVPGSWWEILGQKLLTS